MSPILVPARARSCSPAPAAGQAERSTTRNPKTRSWIMDLEKSAERRLVPRAGSCAAWVPARTYRAAGPCQKRAGLVQFGPVRICGHHAAELDHKGLLDLGAGVRLEERGR